MKRDTTPTIPAAYHRPPSSARSGGRLVSLQVQAGLRVLHRPVYTCPELQPTPGIDDSRFKAYRLPSRIGPRLYWPGGRVTDLDGNEVRT